MGDRGERGGERNRGGNEARDGNGGRGSGERGESRGRRKREQEKEETNLAGARGGEGFRKRGSLVDGIQEGRDYYVKWASSLCIVLREINCKRRFHNPGLTFAFGPEMDIVLTQSGQILVP